MGIFEGFIIICFTLLVGYFLGVFHGAPFVPTDKQTVARMIEVAQIRPGDKLADLGSGDGRILIAAAKIGAMAHGFEINPILVWVSRIKIKNAGLNDRAFVHWKSFWRVNFLEFEIVTLFGITGIMTDLEKKLQTELRPGSRIVSNIFKFPNWPSEKTDNVFLYKIEKRPEQ